MSYTIDFSRFTDPVAKREAGINAAQSYLGDQFPKVIELVTQSVKAGEFTTRKQVHFAMSFVGVQGYPVDALIEKYWPGLAAAAEPVNRQTAAEIEAEIEKAIEEKVENA